jgi:hypothetical protein
MVLTGVSIRTGQAEMGFDKTVRLDAANPRHRRCFTGTAAWKQATFFLSLALGLAARSPAAEPPRAAPTSISGVYPHLAVTGGDECGIGTLVPWAGKLWFSTYGSGGGGNLYSVDENLKLEVRERRLHGLGDRMIHRESAQLFIASCVVDAKGEVRRTTETNFRGTAAARHLADPAGKIYILGMDGALAEVNVHTLQGTRLGRRSGNAKGAIPGGHGKGGYSGYGWLFYAGNGGGGLNRWDGNPDHPWERIAPEQYTDITSPGGLYGARDGDPIWTMGWDRRSVIVKAFDGAALLGESPVAAWHTYRLPKASYTHDSGHGWFTEWPRIREAQPGRFILDHHGMFYDFPKDFRPGRTGGLRPIATRLRMVSDWCLWNGRLVMAHDDASALGSGGLCAQSQSNLWFGAPEDLGSFGKPAGWGGPWVGDAVRAGEPSDPMLIHGFEKRVLHLAHDSSQDVTFTLEVDRDGTGAWTKYERVQVPAGGYAWHIFPADLRAEWVRLKADRDCSATAYFHFSSDGGPADGKDRSEIFSSLAIAGEDRLRSDGGLMHQPVALRGESPRATREASPRLDFLAREIAPQGAVREAGHYEVGTDMTFARVSDASATAALLQKRPKIVPAGESPVPAGYVLPRIEAESPYDAAAAKGWKARTQRSVITERNLANWQGLFYEVPFVGGMIRARPIAAHGRMISDYCCWAGLLVLAGTRPDAEPDGHFFKSADGRTGLWFGKIDDLWHLGKPRGVGGPWRNTAVQADRPSPAYLMTGFDRKTLDLSHDAKRDVTFSIEVDFLATGKWYRYAAVQVPPGKTVRHEFPDGYSAHWVRLIADADCAATAWFIYQ